MSTSDKRTAAFAVLDSNGNPTGEIVAAGKSVTAVTAKTSLDGEIRFSDTGVKATRAAVTDTNPRLPDDTIRITVSGNAIALPCTLKRIRCVAGSAISLAVYDDINDNTGYQFPNFPQTLSAGQEAAIPDGGLVVMHGVYCKFTGTATFDITVGIEQ